MSKARGEILIVEDDAAIALIVAEALRDEAATITAVATLAARDAHLAKRLPDLLITDVILPDGDGLDSLPPMLAEAQVPVIVLSAQNTLDTAVRAADRGSYDYLPKPFDLGELTASVRAALGRKRALAPSGQAATTPISHGLVGRAPSMQAVYRTIARLASNDLAVLILGESGTGKDLVARAIHATGLRQSGPFVAINMAAIPRELIEAELFGHEKGAFTGAVARKTGRFEQASGGTLFLDEIGDMPIEAQTRLLRVLQSGEYNRVGGHAVLQADVRIVAATHRDMPQMVRDGQFREDLYYRLNVIPVVMPPLRERRSDIAALVDHFVADGRATGLPTRSYSAAAIARLEAHDWPGNVRELANMVQRLAVLARDAEVTADDLDPILGHAGAADVVGDDSSAALAAAVASWARGELASAQASQLHGRLADIADAALLRAALAHCDGNQLATARMLGINRNTLRKRLGELHIERGRRGA
jgi:two-component system, NtrC family, nitrogen regulation response regulator GlnG